MNSWRLSKLLNRFSRHCNGHSRRIRLWVVSAGALALGLASCASFEHLTRVSNTFPQAKECGKCHIDIYQEWTTSDHAHAYTNPHFRAATDDYAFGECLNCHAPEPVLTAHTPAVRQAEREEAVTCVACHLDQGELCGPLEPTGKVQPHPIGVRPEVYGDAGICGRCHQGTWEEWAAVVQEKRTCQQCHMPEITRKMTQASGGFSNLIVAMEHETAQRRHVFAIPTADSTGELIELEVRRVETGVEVRLYNRLPHSLPTGDYGFRVLVLEITALDGQGGESALAQMELAPETKTAIPAQGTWNHSAAVPEGSRSLRVRLRRLSYDDQTVLNLLDRTVEL